MFSEHDHPFNNAMLYSGYEVMRSMLLPVNYAATFFQNYNSSPLNPGAYTPFGRTSAASFEVLERITRRYDEPKFDIKYSVVNGKQLEVKEKIVAEKTFCKLVHFRKYPDMHLPKLLIVAPMSGHFATLLRGTVEGLLPFYDVYITDWENARDVPLSKGPFSLDDYIDYVIDFIHVLGKDLHVMAVCQPSVPVLAAVSLMSADNDPLVPKSMILIGGPIDTRKNPTEVNKVATDRPDVWFKQYVITRVPAMYPGFMREVYPGFLQLTGFVSMNLERHMGAHMELFQHLVAGDGESADAHKRFYNEYLSVMDIPAEFYLQTVKTVFKDHSLPKNKMMSRGRKVEPSAIKKTAIIAIEGERDDISGVGQTKAALSLCSSLPESKKHYHLQKKVGHYGTFNGRRFREEIVPAIQAFTKKNS